MNVALHIASDDVIPLMVRTLPTSITRASRAASKARLNCAHYR